MNVPAMVMLVTSLPVVASAAGVDHAAMGHGTAVAASPGGPTGIAFFDWFSGGAVQYHTLLHCMRGDTFWVAATVLLDVAVACGYVLIALHWWRNARLLPASPAKVALAQMRNIFVFCGMCGYLFIPLKLVWPAWRLYDLVMLLLVYWTWRYALSARNLKVIYDELGRGKRLADELEDSRQEARKRTAFINALSHDLRTPLNALVLQATLAEMHLDQATPTSSPPLRQTLDEIKASVGAASELLDCLLEYGRIEGEELVQRAAPVDLAVLIAEVCNEQRPGAEARGLYVRCNVPGGVTVVSDRPRLRRILSNLVGNAVKFTRMGGVRVEVQAVARTGGAEIHVIDTGPGIAAADHDRVFHEFFQLDNAERDRRKGFGLGLAIARRLTLQLGGHLQLVSEPGQGARFTLILPGAAAAPEATDAIARKPAMAMANSRAAVGVGGGDRGPDA